MASQENLKAGVKINPETGDFSGQERTLCDAPEAVPTDTAPGAAVSATATESDGRKKEIGGRDGLDPVRYGDWEKGGRCIDF